ncbi:MAG: monovalent cation/H(+) antiporter subunit G [Bacteroidales bacterium]|nr:monovalent cation/H(+) antiporter subunit G [Bacteroidales bacterium]MDT8432847.1 monovalent cation/H(+) antiporter subunit G [Bacteroidales bacterium]
MTALTSILLFLGSVFILIASIGLLRFRESFSRMHATTKATSFGLLLILAGVVFYFLSFIVAIKALLVIVFVYLTAPLAAHSISKTVRNTGKNKR